MFTHQEVWIYLLAKTLAVRINKTVEAKHALERNSSSYRNINVWGVVKYLISHKSPQPPPISCRQINECGSIFGFTALVIIIALG